MDAQSTTKNSCSLSVGKFNKVLKIACYMCVNSTIFQGQGSHVEKSDSMSVLLSLIIEIYSAEINLRKVPIFFFINMLCLNCILSMFNALSHTHNYHY